MQQCFFTINTYYSPLTTGFCDLASERCQTSAIIDAVNMHKNTNIAAGIAAVSLICSLASNIPSPAFCIPISIASVRRLLFSILNNAPTPYPEHMP